MKRLLSLILSIVLMISLVPANLLTPHVHAETDGEHLHLEEGSDEGSAIAESAEAVSIELATLPDKLTYLEQKDALDVTGATLRVLFNDETEQVIDVTAEMITGFDNTIIGTQTLTVQYNELQTTFDVEIVAKTIIGISIYSLPEKLEYKEGETLDLTGGEITVEYDNGTVGQVALTECEISDAVLSEFGHKTILISYSGFSAEFEVAVDHAFSQQMTWDSNEHWFACPCGETLNLEKHQFDNDCDTQCNKCEYVRTVEDHDYDNACDADCNICGDVRDVPDHVYDNECDIYCNVCDSKRVVGDHVAVRGTLENDSVYPFTFNDGIYTSTNKEHNTSSVFTLYITAGGTIELQYKTSTETNYDKIIISHNGEVKVTDSGTKSWTGISIPVIAEDVVTIAYTKDYSQASGSDEVSFKFTRPLAPTCEEGLTCEECGEEIEAATGHAYTNDCDTTCNNCGLVRTVGAHQYDNSCDKTCNICGDTRTISHTYDNSCDQTCNVCGKKRNITHTYDNTCDQTCNVCGKKRNITHTYDNACDSTCNVCGKTRTVGAHQYDNACDKTCNVCGKTRTVPAHKYNNACDTTCNVCGATRTISHTYSAVCDPSCNVCGKTRTVTHTYTASCDKTCNVCGTTRTAPSAHTTGVSYTFVNDSCYPFSYSSGTYSSTNRYSSSTATAEINITNGGTLQIQYKTSTEANYDKLIIKQNSTQKVVASGETTWTTLTLTVYAGDVIYITYNKDGSANRGSDTVYFKILNTQSTPTCTNAVRCTVCNEVAIAALGHSYDNACDKTCNTCGHTRTVGAHKYDNACDKTCNTCGKTRTVGAHKYTNSCDTTCNTCGKTRTITHTYSNKCDKTCNVCGKTRTVGAHKYDNACDKTCNYCGKTRTVGAHKYSSKCDASCNVCGKTRTVTHTYKTTTTKATLTKSGKTVKKCTVCGKVASTTTIKYVKTIKLSADSYTYNGKARTPSVTVKDSSGKALKLNTDYKVTYASGRKNVGTYKVTIKLIGKYSGTKTLSFKILPTAKTSVTGYIGDTINIGAKSNTTIQYSSSNKSIATVSSKGVITAVGAGTATITVKSGSVSQKITVKVTKPSITISAPSSSMYIGKTMKLTATAKPSSGKVTWSVNNTKLATISSNGTLTAKYDGTVTVTAKLTYKGKTYSKTYKVSISVEYPDVSIFISSKFEYSSSYAFIITNKGTSSLKIKGSGYVYCNGDSENIDSLYIGDGKFYEWVSIKPGASITMVACLENKMQFYTIRPTTLAIDLEYNGQEFTAYCSTDRSGVDKNYKLTWWRPSN